MPSRAGAARKVADNALNSCAGHIWISDELLQETYSRFAVRGTTHFKRHGSNVPGPLEARRRLTKRRYNDLSLSIGGVTPHVDPVVNLGWLGKLWSRPVTQDWRWEPPCSQQKDTGLHEKAKTRTSIHTEIANYDITITFPDLPPWFGLRHPDQPPLVAAVPWGAEAVPALDLDSISISNTVNAFEDYKHHLAEVRNLEDLRKLYFHARDANLDTSECSSLAFNHLLALYCDARETKQGYSQIIRNALFEFLQDSSLDLSNGLNFLHMADFLEGEVVSVGEFYSLREILALQLRTRQLLTHTLPPLMQKLFAITSKAYYSQAGTLLSAYRNFWDIILEAQAEISLHDNAAIRRMLLSHVLDMPAQDQGRRFVERILRHDSRHFHSACSNFVYDQTAIQQIWTHNKDWHHLLARVARFFFLLNSQNSHGTITSSFNRTSRFLASLNQSAYVEGLAALATEQIIDGIMGGVSDRTSDLEVLRHWLRAVGKGKYVWCKDYTGTTWAYMFNVIAKVFSPAEILLRLQDPPWHQINLLVLRHWVKRSLDVDSNITKQAKLLPDSSGYDANADMGITNSSSRPVPNDLYSDGPSCLAMVANEQTVLPDEIEMMVQADSSQFGYTTEWSDIIINQIERTYALLSDRPMFVDLVCRKQVFGLAEQALNTLLALERVYPNSYEPAAEHFLEIALAHKSWRVFDMVARGIKRSIGLQFTIRHRRLLEQHIREHGKRCPESALRVFNLDRRLSLSRVPNLVLDLISASTVHIKRCLALLWHTDSDAFVAPAYRQYHPKCAITPERIHLVHEAAESFAVSKNFSSSAVWTAVLRCYYFLRTHHAPMGPTLSRAIVVAGLVRPMKAGESIHVDKIRFIVRIVRRIDGEKAADEVDRACLVYTQSLQSQARVEDRVMAVTENNWHYVKPGRKKFKARIWKATWKN